VKLKINILLFLLFANVTSFSQTVAYTTPNLKYLNYIFPADSLFGFDEATTQLQALQGGFFGTEFKVVMYQAKRSFINKKYGYSIPVTIANFNANKDLPPTVNAAPCVNEDFEASASTTGTTAATSIGNTLAGWVVTSGQNQWPNGSCLQSGCCPTVGTNDAWVRTTPYTAPAPLGVIPNSPLGGTKVLQMNDNIWAQGEVVRIQQTFPVTATNALFQFAYLAMMNGAGHACCDQPYMRIELVDCMNTPLACPIVTITPPGPSCATVTSTGWATNSLSISYTPSWIVKSIDLSPYLGTCITIKITVGDCDGWAHYGMAFVDCVCLPMTINVNNLVFPAGTSAIAVAACGVATASLVAPAGMGPYSWTGPPASGIASNTNQAVNTTVAGNYTLVMSPPGLCAPITKTVSLSFSTFPNGGFTRPNTCTTYTLTNSGSASPAVQTYSIIGPGGPPTFTTTSPTSVVNLAPSTTYTIYQTVTNAAGCYTTTSQVITTPSGPSPAFTAQPSFTQCLTGNAFTFSATTSAGTHTYNFTPTVGAPATGNTANYGAVNFTAPGSYTVTHTVNSAGCVTAASSVIVVSPTPTISVASGTVPGCAGNQATLTASGGPGSLTWTGPNSYTAVGGGTTTINNFQTINNGIYTITASNNGCSTTRTVNLTMTGQPVVTISNDGPYCIGATAQYTVNISPGYTLNFPGGSYWYETSWWWYAGNITGPVVPNIQLSSSGTYYFDAYFTNGCYATASMVVTVNPCFLPIELLDFSTNCYNNAIEVNWETATERDNKHFTILRSEDGIFFEVIAIVSGAGNSNSSKRYSYIDKNVEAGKTYYYKLRQTDYNNSESDVGKISSVLCNKKNYVLDIFPNPSSNEVYVISEKDLYNVNVNILDAMGQNIKTITNVDLIKNERFVIDIRDVINGCYQLVITGNEVLIQKKILTYK
jgi:hypothetical protein